MGVIGGSWKDRVGVMRLFQILAFLLLSVSNVKI